MKYDALLMLSGGKDSCALALRLFKEKQTVLLFTNDTGFMSQVAFDNIEKIKTITNFTHIINSDSIKYHKALVDYYFQNAQLRMEKDLCHYCTCLTEYCAQKAAKEYNIKTIYNGHSSYQMGLITSEWLSKKQSQIVNGIRWEIPYLTSYNINEIKTELESYNIESCPIKTNCIPIKNILQEEIRRSNKNPFSMELEKAFNNNDISEEDYIKYKEFCVASSKRLHKNGYFSRSKIKTPLMKHIKVIDKNKI